ncbi:MAG: chorismate-binding protein [Oscillatoriales cyanobacterium SM2_1_8]|nr:chorismate-binding protein [Oscillatoriales cyanobacterium SM2_1_8]
MTESAASGSLTGALTELAQWLAGDFSNWAQAIENPPFFAHIRVCLRPLAGWEGGHWFYLEQAYDYALHQPYRTAVLKLHLQDGQLAVVNHRLLNPEAHWGAARDRSRLADLMPDAIAPLAGCNALIVRTAAGTYRGVVEPGKRCRVVRNGRETYLHNEFEVGNGSYTSLDCGYDPVTDERVWGAVAGPFEFIKKECFAQEVGSEVGN